MTIREHAAFELKKAGLFDDDSDYRGEVGHAVMELIEAFATQRHSGGSASMTIDLLNRLLAHDPLTPLTGEDSEWCDPMGDGQLLQNKRCSRVFKDAKGAYDIRGDERRSVTFPYLPRKT